jgi:ABC-type transport system substrate-binding protein
MEFGSGLELSINTSTKPLDQIKVRQAIFQSMDPWMAIEDMWLGLGFVSVGIPLFDQDWILPEQDLRNYFGSRELAIDLMNDLASDSTNYVKLSVAHYSDAHLNYGEKIAQSMEDIGFTVDVNTLNIEQYEEVWHSGEYQILIGPAIPVSGTNSYLNAVLHSDGKANTSHHRDQYLDRLIEKQSKTTDLLLRKKLLGDIQRHVIDRAIKFMPVSKVSRWVYWPRVNNFTPNFAGGEYFYLSKVWVTDN